MIRLLIDPASPIPLYRQVSQRLREAMASGALPIGESLPGVRELAMELGINYHTIARAYQELEEAGLLSRQRGGPFLVSEQAVVAANGQQLRERLQEVAQSAISQGISTELLRLWWEEILAKTSKENT